MAGSGVARAVYRSPRWRALAAQAIEAAGWRCQSCDERGHSRAGGVTGAVLEVHHRVAVADGGEPFPPLAGLIVLCRDCHMREHGKRPGARDPAWAAWRKRTRRAILPSEASKA